MIIPALLLLTLGIAAISTDRANSSLAIQQLIFALVGMGGYYIVSQFDFRSTKQLLRYSYLFILICLIITFFLGKESHGAVRWIPLGPFYFQPSEFAKPIIIITLASFWSNRLATWRNIGLSLCITLPIIGLIFSQPDLGTALTVFFIWAILLFAANISMVKIGIMSLIGAILLPFGWLHLQEYQKQRIYTFLTPSSDPQNTGFHVIQSMIAVGSGELFGRGIGRGTQSHLQFLPEFHTDFVFAFIAEELGFIGSVIILVLYFIIFFLMLQALSKIDDRFGELIIIGVMAMLLFQITVNIGMNIGVLPVTGITLPLLSYGGSSLITTLISFGLVASALKYGTKKKEITSFSLL